MTYIVFGRTLNIAQLNYIPRRLAGAGWSKIIYTDSTFVQVSLIGISQVA